QRPVLRESRDAELQLQLSIRYRKPLLAADGLSAMQPHGDGELLGALHEWYHPSEPRQRATNEIPVAGSLGSRLCRPYWIVEWVAAVVFSEPILLIIHC